MGASFTTRFGLRGIAIRRVGGWTPSVVALLGVATVVLSCGGNSRRVGAGPGPRGGASANAGGPAGDGSGGGGAAGTAGTAGAGDTGGAAGEAGEGGASTGVYAAVDVEEAACALLLDGSVQCWGADLAGVPRGMGGYARLSLARSGGCGLKEVDGRTQCFRLVSNSFEPAPIPLAGTARYQEIDMAGTGLLCGLTADTGEVLCQGDGAPVAPVPGSFTQFSLGYDGATTTYSGCALTPGGSAACWKWDTDVVVTPTPDGPFRQIATGGRHACAIVRASSSITCWGSDDLGQSSPPSGDFDSVAAGDAHSCGLRPSGLAECWGDDAEGQSTPPPDVTFSQVSAGRTASCGVTTDHFIRCWGNRSSWSALPPEG